MNGYTMLADSYWSKERLIRKTRFLDFLTTCDTDEK